jgi:hypothetical protein
MKLILALSLLLSLTACSTTGDVVTTHKSGWFNVKNNVINELMYCGIYDGRPICQEPLILIPKNNQ